MGDTKQKLRVWWIPQIPMKSFLVPVDSVIEGAKVMKILADYDQFQYDNRVKPDYCNIGGLQVFDPTDDTDGPEGSWVDWYDEEHGCDDPFEYVEIVGKDL